MIIHLKKETGLEKANQIATENQAFLVEKEDKFVLISSSSQKAVIDKYNDFVTESFVFPNDMQLASKEYMSTTREIQWGNVKIGGNTNNTVMIAGPCSVESEEQIQESSALLKELNLTMLRAGCYKPRTSPYSFQGMGLEGLQLLAKMRQEH